MHIYFVWCLGSSFAGCGHSTFYDVKYLRWLIRRIHSASDAVFGTCCATQWGPLNGAWSTRFLGLNHYEARHIVLGFGTVFDDKDGSTGCGSPTTQVAFGAHPCLSLPEGGEIMGALWVGIICPEPLCGWSGKPGLLDRDALGTTRHTRSNKTEGCQKPTQIVFNTGHKFDVSSTTPEIDADLLWDYWKAQTEVKGKLRVYCRIHLSKIDIFAMWFSEGLLINS